ncbi:hypothetical protein QTN25_000682 [Entamoeba marina]
MSESRTTIKDLEFINGTVTFKCHFELQRKGEFLDTLTVLLKESRTQFQTEYTGNVEVLFNAGGLDQLTKIIDVVESNSKFFLQFDYKGMAVRVLAKLSSHLEEFSYPSSPSPSRLRRSPSVSNAERSHRKSNASRTMATSIITDSAFLELKRENKELRSLITDLSQTLDSLKIKFDSIESHSSLDLDKLSIRIDNIERSTIESINTIKNDVEQIQNNQTNILESVKQSNDHTELNSEIMKIQTKLDNVCVVQEQLTQQNKNKHGIVNDNLLSDTIEENKKYIKKHAVGILVKHNDLTLDGLCLLLNSSNTTEVKILVNLGETVELFTGETSNFNALCNVASTAFFSLDTTCTKLNVHSSSVSLVLQHSDDNVPIWPRLIDLYKKVNDINTLANELDAPKRVSSAIPETFEVVSSNVIDHNCVTSDVATEENRKHIIKQTYPILDVTTTTFDTSVADEEDVRDYVFVSFSEKKSFNKSLLEQLRTQVPNLHFVDYRYGIKKHHFPTKIILYYFCSDEDADYRVVMKKISKEFKKVPLYVLCVKMPGKAFMLDTDGVQFIYISKLMRTNLIDTGSAFKKLITDIY